jgi:twitching motility protein PilJ
MALRIPFMSKGKKEENQEGYVAAGEFNLPDNPLETATTVLAQSVPDASVHLSPSGRSTAPHSGANPNVTLIGEALQKSGDISLPLIGNLPLQQQVRILGIMLVSAMVLGVLFVYLNSNHSTLASTQTQIAGDALMHSQRIGKATPNAIQGNLEAFKQLDESRKELTKDLKVLSNGGNYQGTEISAPSAKLNDILKDTQKDWANSDKAAETILNLKNELAGFGATLQKLNTLSPVLLELTEQIATLKAQSQASPREVSAAGQLEMLTQRLGRSASEFMTAEGVNPETAFLLGKDTNTFRDITDGFLNGSEVLRLPVTKDQDTREKLTELQTAFGDYQQSVQSILGNLQNFIAAKQSELLIAKMRNSKAVCRYCRRDIATSRIR